MYVYTYLFSWIILASLLFFPFVFPSAEVEAEELGKKIILNK